MSKTLDNIAEAIGLPSQNDKERIQRILLRYERKYPGRVINAIQQARKEWEGDELKLKYGEVNKAAAGRVLFELPEDLGTQITSVAPLVFKDKKHLKWFVKNFPELLIPRKY